MYANMFHVYSIKDHIFHFVLQPCVAPEQINCLDILKNNFNHDVTAGKYSNSFSLACASRTVYSERFADPHGLA